MERKLRNATAKLRNLKDFLSSTRSLTQVPQGPSSSSTSPYHHQPHQSNRKSSKGSSGSGMPLSVSLFDLVEPCSRPTSMTISSSFPNNGPLPGGSHQNSNASVSMYGLTSGDLSEGLDIESPTMSHVRSTSGVPSSKNPAIRLFYTIRSKFRKRRRDRITKIVDSKSADFVSYTSGNKTPYGNSSGAHGGGDAASRFQLESSQSVDQLQYLSVNGFEDDSFSSPLGCRDRNYGKENSEPLLLTTATSCFVINDNIVCRSPANAAYDSNQMDQFSSCSMSTLASPRPTKTCQRPSTSFARSTSSPAATVVPSTSTTPSTPSSPAEPNKLKGLAKELFDLIHYGWYWGGLSKEEAEVKLKDEPDGAFIVRDSSSNVHILSLSFNSKGKTKHTRIDYVDGKFCFLASETEAFPSVAELIEHWINNSEQGIFCYSKSNRANGPTSYPVRLSKPISRFTEVKSLQFLSSFVLYQYTRLDLIPKLPLPPQLIEFIGQQHYF